MSDLVSAVEEYLGPRLDCVYVYTLDRIEVSNIEVMDLKVNKAGTVSMFLTRTDLDDNQVDEFIKKLERELR